MIHYIDILRSLPKKSNIVQSIKQDGNRLIYITGPRVIGNPNLKELETKELFLDRNDFKGLTIQTRHGIEFGNWNIIR